MSKRTQEDSGEERVTAKSKPMINLVARGDGVPKACPEQAAADSRGSRTCVCAKTFFQTEWHTQG